MLLQPWDLLDVMPLLQALEARAFDDGILSSRETTSVTSAPKKETSVHSSGTRRHARAVIRRGESNRR